MQSYNSPQLVTIKLTISYENPANENYYLYL